MAFVSPTLPLVAARAPRAHTCPSMSDAARVPRRAALRLAALSLTSAATVALAGQFDLGDLKEDVEELSYEDEVTDVGPDAKEKNITRIKKKQAEPAYRAEEAKRIKDEEAAYEAMVEKEAAEEARLKAEFSGK